VLGARAVQQSILGDYPEVDISVIIVWISMLEGDSEVAAGQAAKGFLTDSRVRQFYDPRQLAGAIVAQGLGAQEGKVAWDLYLFYEKGSIWTQAPPTPAHWMHQLLGSSWADSAHLYRGNALVLALQKTMGKLVYGAMPPGGDH
jgi:hypothetical protein